MRKASLVLDLELIKIQTIFLLKQKGGSPERRPTTTLVCQ